MPGNDGIMTFFLCAFETLYKCRCHQLDFRQRAIRKNTGWRRHRSPTEFPAWTRTNATSGTSFMLFGRIPADDKRNSNHGLVPFLTLPAPMHQTFSLLASSSLTSIPERTSRNISGRSDVEYFGETVTLHNVADNQSPNRSGDTTDEIVDRKGCIRSIYWRNH